VNHPFSLQYEVHAMRNDSTSSFFFKYLLNDAVFFHAHYEYDIGFAFERTDDEKIVEQSAVSTEVIHDVMKKSE
jgi:hypothetical protein